MSSGCGNRAYTSALLPPQTIRHNTLESAYLITSMFILLAGMAFQSGVTPVGSKSYTFLTVIVAAVLVVSTVTFVGVLALEVYKSTRHAQRHRRSITSASQPKRAGNGGSDWEKFTADTAGSEAPPLSCGSSPLHTVTGMIGREHAFGQTPASSSKSDRLGGTIIDRLLRRRRSSITVRTRAASFVKSSAPAASPASESNAPNDALSSGALAQQHGGADGCDDGKHAPLQSGLGMSPPLPVPPAATESPQVSHPRVDRIHRLLRDATLSADGSARARSSGDARTGGSSPESSWMMNPLKVGRSREVINVEDGQSVSALMARESPSVSKPPPPSSTSFPTQPSAVASEWALPVSRLRGSPSHGRQRA